MDDYVAPHGPVRAARLFGPIIAMMLGGLSLLAMLAVLLVNRIDAAAILREGEMVRHGFALQNDDLKAVIVPQVNWDEAVKALDYGVDQDWADLNLGSYLYTFNGFTRVIIVNGAGQAVYAAADGKRASLHSAKAFAPISKQLIAPLRLAEAKRPPIRAGANGQSIVTTPLQTVGIHKAGEAVYVVIATLVQPDFGLILPRSKQAPVTITAIPVNAAMLDSFGKRFLLDGLRLLPADQEVQGKVQLILHTPSGEAVGKLVWIPRAVGSILFRNLLLPVLATIILMALLAWTIIRRGETVVRDLVASEARAKHLAFHDPLTQLPNRALLFERLRHALADPAIADRPVAVFCLDLDRFKDVNDSLGHPAGDLLISVMARRLLALCDGKGTISRLGGDEFVAIQRCASEAEARELAQRIRADLARPVQSEFGVMEVGASVGVALITRRDVEAGEALRWADIAMYRAKEAGRGRVTLFEPGMDTVLRKRRELESDLRTALAEDQLHMVYQPQVDRSGTVCGLEALLRWQHPQHGAISPGLFVPLAEESGLINQLGQFVLRRVFAETRQWPQVRIAINISAIQLRMPDFAGLVAGLARELGIALERYEIEVTETALLGDDRATADNIERLKQLGLSIALDDFGTGYSSLSVLQAYSVDRIKIDRAFVGCLGLDSNANALVTAMVQLAAALDLGIIAEGVETDDQMLRLIACGCHEFQGHLFSEPMIGPVLTDWLRGHAIQPQRKLRKRA